MEVEISAQTSSGKSKDNHHDHEENPVRHNSTDPAYAPCASIPGRSTSTVTFRPNRLIKIIQDRAHSDTMIVMTEKTDNYRLLAASQIQSTDHVLEIGCSNGECSLVISKYVKDGSLVAFDTSREMISQAQEKMRLTNGNSIKNVQFHVVDPFIDPRRAILLARGGANGKESNVDCAENNISVVLIDIGGNRDLGSVLKMLAWARESFTPRLCIIKSKEMVDQIKADFYSCAREIKSNKEDENMPMQPPKKSKPWMEIQPCGMILNGEEWYHTTTTKMNYNSNNHSDMNAPAFPRPRFSHPKKAPLSLSPKDGKTPICRYYNYHKNGCLNTNCTNDHTYCHWCLKPGHIARNCITKE